MCANIHSVERVCGAESDLVQDSVGGESSLDILDVGER